MKDNISLTIAIIAIILSFIAVGSSFFMKEDYSIEDGSIDKNKLADDSVTTVKIINGTIVDDDICNNGISKISNGAISLDNLDSSVLDAMVEAGIIVDNSISGKKIMNETITADDIQDYTKTISFPANVLNHQETDIISDVPSGLLWKASFESVAFLIIPRPYDWDGNSDVIMYLYFISNYSDSGIVQFFIRPRSYDQGDIFEDETSLDGNLVTVTAPLTIYKQDISIPAEKFGSKELWVISIQRQSGRATYTDDVILSAVALSYTADR